MSGISRRYGPSFLLILSLVVAACGGGGGGVDSTPVISDLQFLPASALQYEGNGTVTITGTFNFSDPGKDLATLYVTTSAGDHLSAPISGAAGANSGSIQGELQVGTTILGHYTIQLYVVDGLGNRSNTLSGAFDVNPNDTASYWTARALPLPPGSSASMRRVRWSGSQFVAVGARSDPTSGLMRSLIDTSLDGVTWTERSFGSGTNLNDVVWAGTKFIAVGDHGEVLTSADGVSWSSQAIPTIPGAMLNGIAASGTSIVAVGTKADQANTTVSLILTSTDGIDWSEVPATYSAQLNAIVWSGDQFVAVGTALGQPNAAPMVLTSNDGAAWNSSVISLPTMSVFHDVAWNGTNLVAVGYAGAASSNDGITWQETGAGVVGANYAVGWSGKRFLTCGVLYCESSTDANLWSTAATLPGTPAVYGLAWGDNKWVAVGADSIVLTSP